MRNKKNELVLSAISLVQIGERLEKTKERLGELVARGIPYESEKMKEALEEYLQLYCFLIKWFENHFIAG